MKRDLLPRPPRSTQLITVTAIALAVLGSFSIVSAGFVWKQAFDNTQKGNINFSDPSRYREIRYKLWSNQNLVKHFPPDIPVESSRVYLAYSRASEQGSSFLQLRLKLPNRQIQNLLQQYRAIAKYSYKGGNTNDHSNLPHGVPTTFFYTSGTQEDSFPVSYEILVLDAHNQGNSDFEWNHGDSYGVAIDSSASEIIYWVEQW
jgi:hypothetical protein